MLLIYLGRLVQGAGEVPVWAQGPAWLSVENPSARGRVTGLYNAAMHLGLTSGPFLGLAIGAILGPAWTADGPFHYFVLTALAGAAFGLVFGRGTVPGPRPLREVTLSGPKENPARSGFPAALLTGVGLYGAGYGLLLTSIPACLIDQMGFSPDLTGLYFTGFFLGRGPVSSRGRPSGRPLGPDARNIGRPPGIVGRPGPGLTTERAGRHPGLRPGRFGAGRFCRVRFGLPARPDSRGQPGPGRGRVLSGFRAGLLFRASFRRPTGRNPGAGRGFDPSWPLCWRCRRPFGS